MKQVAKTVTEALLRRWPLPELDGTLGKEERGTVLVIGGSDEVWRGAPRGGRGAARGRGHAADRDHPPGGATRRGRGAGVACRRAAVDARR